MATFSGRLRSEIDLESLTGELLHLVDETLQPSQSAVVAAGARARAQRYGRRARSSTSRSVA